MLRVRDLSLMPFPSSFPSCFHCSPLPPHWMMMSTCSLVSLVPASLVPSPPFFLFSLFLFLSSGFSSSSSSSSSSSLLGLGLGLGLELGLGLLGLGFNRDLALLSFPSSFPYCLLSFTSSFPHCSPCPPLPPRLMMSGLVSLVPASSFSLPKELLCLV